MNAVKLMEQQGIVRFQTVVYDHPNPRVGKVDCIVTHIKTGGVMLRSINNQDQMFLVRGGDNLKRIIA